MEINSIEDIQHVYYINLEDRKDRKEKVENELQKIKLKAKVERFNAIKMTNGAIGCSMSHLKCLEQAKKLHLPHIFICEDDIEFLNPTLFISQLNNFFESTSTNDWDVVLVAGNNMIPFNAINNFCIQVFNCQTTTGYIVKNKYFDKLIANYKEGIQLLLRNQDKKQLYAIDKYWLQLQKHDKWYLIIPLSVVQRIDFSDIEGKITNFQNYMLNYNKAYK
jgi:GR25 family glycosyltransferase involved in LPS biosynthesis